MLCFVIDILSYVLLCYYVLVTLAKIKFTLRLRCSQCNTAKSLKEIILPAPETYHNALRFWIFKGYQN